MTCTGVKLPGGQTAIVCGPRPKRKKCGCGRWSTLLCDWKVVRPSGAGTCDAPLCDRCATHPVRNGRTDFDKDLCPKHAAEWEARRGK